jgi:hypothetical protein
MMSVKELNQKMNKQVYMLIVDNVLVAAGIENDMNKYLKWDDGLLMAEQGVDDLVQLLFGFVLNPAELPYDIPSSFMEGKMIYVIESDKRDRITVEACNTMPEATYLIETAMKCGEDLELDDFAVIVAKELDIVLAVGESGKYIRESDVYGDD